MKAITWKVAVNHRKNFFLGNIHDGIPGNNVINNVVASFPAPEQGREAN